MNNFKKIGLTALAGSLVTLGSAQAGEMSVSGGVNTVLKFGKGATRGGDFDFASSNPLWRSAVNVLDFVPLTNASYSGGIIITEWFSAENSSGSNSRELKLTIRFMTNEIRADALQVIVFEKSCVQNDCKTKKIKSKLESELKLAILKKAALFEKDDFKKYKELDPSDDVDKLIKTCEKNLSSN